MQPHKRGLLAVDKQGNRVLFLNPDSFAVEQELNALPPRPHELLMLPALEKAYVPIYGDGVHGDNPHPGHKVAIIDLRRRRFAALSICHRSGAAQRPAGTRWQSVSVL